MSLLNQSLKQFGAVLLTAGLVAACGGGTTTTTTQSPAGDTTAAAGGTTAGGGDVSGSVLVDGSSTVFPISEAMAEEFMAANPGVRVTVGVSGTGGGFKKFCAGETDISNASRPIKQEEIEACEAGGVEFVELPIAFDGLSVVVNPENDFAQCLTVDELKTMWEPAAQGTINNWNQIRPDFPSLNLGLYGPGTDSGTYDYFAEAIVGEDGTRGDFTASEDDNVIVQGVSADPGGLGFFGYAYYVENQDRLKLVEIDGGDGCVAPSEQTIADGTYQPLSRPEFIYVKTTSLDNPAVRAFVDFQMDPANANLIQEVGYVPMPNEINELRVQRIEDRKTGSVFEGGSAVGTKLSDLLAAEQ
ncbi:PstS family phosphate ABC transporter substrate-binding protein [Thermocoleostomius sinensis]|jgi:phosphate transport system substrate-binding protein|uniref:Phosphate-binding protein n=1 Tax=Thermocoleostomius sinensis A174 TaxID=2016057 RepID=A0A9E8ZDY5_9CYAN|nr:PstS family phosphate ABC transporter substrate-binding protein [Thermocoleostomius sinensis]WAL59618.1 PstS family phosphate ABC transporter substrate-binding protein [Thermocoleostomius sinensis A174]